MKNVYLLPTDKQSRLFIDIEDNKLKITIPIGGEHMMNQNIYITNDEEIKEGDLFITNNSEIFKCIKNKEEQCFYSVNASILTKFCKKIILTTDQDLIKNGVQVIPDEFLEWFVKNPSCDEVETIYGLFNPMGRQVDPMNLGQNHSECIWKYKIIIPKEETKQETLEEVAERLIKLNRQDAFYEGAKWQMDKQSDFIIGFLEFIEGTYSYSNIFDHWYLHADTSKTYSKKQLLEIYLKRNKL